MKGRHASTQPGHPSVGRCSEEEEARELLVL